MDAPNYTYVRVKSSTGEVWAAGARFKVAVGDRLTVPLDTPMENFESKSLKRTFPLIYFINGLTSDSGAQPAAAAPAVPIKVDPCRAAQAWADVWAGRKALSGKSIKVRGRVVKFNGGILGRNWIHIQDGTGSPKEGTDDLTVTSDAAATVGSVVTFAAPSPSTKTSEPGMHIRSCWRAARSLPNRNSSNFSCSPALCSDNRQEIASLIVKSFTSSAE
jgi:hypothetical protein